MDTLGDWLFLIVLLIIASGLALLPLVLLAEAVSLTPRRTRRRRWRFGMPLLFFLPAAVGTSFYLTGFGLSDLQGGVSLAVFVLAVVGVLCVFYLGLILVVDLFPRLFAREQGAKQHLQRPDGPIGPADEEHDRPRKRKRRRWWARMWQTGYRPLRPGKDHQVPLDLRDESGS